MTTEKSQENTKPETQISAPIIGEESVEYQKYIANVRELVFTVGFNRSGSSLIGDLLDGHPNIVMANEAGVIRRYTQGTITSREYLLTLIIKNSMNKRRKRRKNFISGQNCYDRIEVMGDKHSSNNTFALMEENFNTLEKLSRLVKLPIKFLFNVRNPYDMISSKIIKVSDPSMSETENFEKTISYFTECSDKNLELIKQVSPDKMFMIRHEDFIASPKNMLKDICDFLSVTPTPDYLRNCASTTYKIPRRNRYKLNWSEELKRKVDKLIETYEFFDGYSWDS